LVERLRDSSYLISILREFNDIIHGIVLDLIERSMISYILVYHIERSVISYIVLYFIKRSMITYRVPYLIERSESII